MNLHVPVSLCIYPMFVVVYTYDWCQAVSVCVRALKGKLLELSTPYLVDMQCMESAGHALTRVQKVKVTSVLKLI